MGYRERRLARAERLRGWAEKRQAKQGALNEAACCDEAKTGIPFGQPILVGHHSERRHRRAIEKIDRAMRASIDNAKKAASMDSRADAIERQAERAIYSDDADAPERLREKIAEMEAKRARMVARNAEFRKTHRAELKAAAGAYERSMMMPHQAYELQNLGGNITRARKRLELLSGQPNRAAAAKREGTTATARAGLVIVASMTTPSRPGKQPRPVWNVMGEIGAWRQFLIDAGGSWYRGAFSFWEDPTEQIERACADAEQTAAADVVAEFARELETREASAGPIAEVPFSLQAEPATRHAVDGRLF